MTPRKNPAAVALGRRGGRANTAAQQAARKANAQFGKLGGRPHTRHKDVTIEGRRVCRLCGRTADA